MSHLTRAEILANRQQVVKFLQQPKRKKAQGSLDRGDGKRCCLGHMCYVLGLKRTPQTARIAYGHSKEVGYAPTELLSLLGLYCVRGGSKKLDTLRIEGNTKYHNLASINDNTDTTPQAIGKYLESVIEGGENTPWAPLSIYPETLA
jgi:hypothetical protein